MTINRPRRLEYLRALRRFKYGVKVRAKLGVLDPLCEQVSGERLGRSLWDRPDWSHDRWITLLYTSIRDNEFPHELLLGFVRTAEITFTFFTPRRQPTIESVLMAVEGVLAAQRTPLRTKFGVFDEET